MMLQLVLLVGGLVVLLVSSFVRLRSTRRIAVGIADPAAAAPADASRLTVLTGFVSLITIFMIVRLVLEFPVWAYAAWLPAVTLAVTAAWHAGQSFGRLPWLPQRHGGQQIVAAALEVLVALLIAVAFLGPHLFV